MDAVILSVLLGAVITLLRDALALDRGHALFSPPVLVFTDLLEVEAAHSGFSSAATVTIAALSSRPD